ncbi:MAG: YlbF family regulator [Christensenellaceae bacterium]|jgi:cell fate (sporulation/competence/biofilm development) regulator YlbF (YheA/YmcA/DUF963 family)
MNAYDKAHELARDIKETQEYKDYIAVRDEVYEDEQNKRMIRDYKKLNFELQTIYMAGKEPAEEDAAKLQKMGEVLQFNPKITEFFAKEYKFNTLVSDIYKIIGEACDIGVDFYD